MKEQSTDQTGRAFALMPAGISFVLFECLVAIQAFLAYSNHSLTLAQMQQHDHAAHGLPFVWHFGMWGDGIIVSSVAAYLVGRHLAEWRLHCMLVSLVSGFLSAIGFTSILHRWTPAGFEHLLYMGIVLSVFIQFFFFTENIAARELRIVSGLLLIHIFLGTQMALGIVKVVAPLDWYPIQPLKNPLGWLTFVSVILALAWRNFSTPQATLRPSTGNPERRSVVDPSTVSLQGIDSVLDHDLHIGETDKCG